MKIQLGLLIAAACAIAVVDALEGYELQEAIKDLPTAKVEKSHKKFKFFDKDGDTFVTREEFEAGLKKLGKQGGESVCKKGCFSFSQRCRGERNFGGMNF